MDQEKIPPGSDKNTRTQTVENREPREGVTLEQMKRFGELLSEILRKGGATDGIDRKSFEAMLRMDDDVWPPILRLIYRRAERQNQLPVLREFEIDGEKIEVSLYRLVPFLLDTEIQSFYESRGLEPISPELLYKIHTVDPNLKKEYHTVTHFQGPDGTWYVSDPYRPWGGEPHKLVNSYDSIEFSSTEDRLYLVGVKKK
ncbi:MAG TPA: hypothetical protein VGO63_02855 [Candidatus Paceibacterota bacterium]|jgi:hypothetical protein|nr:hypothetical protein [Candidatus Paceibacterota bacterium]